VNFSLGLIDFAVQHSRRFTPQTRSFQAHFDTIPSDANAATPERFRAQKNRDGYPIPVADLT
jgi:hypothetical protein